MYMKSNRLDTPQNILNVDLKTIKEWQVAVNQLIKLNDQDLVLYVKDLFEKNDVKFLISEDQNILMNIEQTVLEDNCSMTLKQWRECLNSLVRKFGEEAYLYTSKRDNVKLFLSEIA